MRGNVATYMIEILRSNHLLNGIHYPGMNPETEKGY